MGRFWSAAGGDHLDVVLSRRLAPGLHSLPCHPLPWPVPRPTTPPHIFTPGHNGALVHNGLLQVALNLHQKLHSRKENV